MWMMNKVRRLVRVRTVEPLNGFLVRVTFDDGTQRTIDLDIYLRGPIFEGIRSDPAVFRAMRVEGGTLAWENGADIDPDVLYHGLTPAWAEEPELAGSLPC
jgi:hypothetical protein